MLFMRKFGVLALVLVFLFAFSFVAAGGGSRDIIRNVGYENVRSVDGDVCTVDLYFDSCVWPDLVITNQWSSKTIDDIQTDPEGDDLGSCWGGQLVHQEGQYYPGTAARYYVRDLDVSCETAEDHVFYVKGTCSGGEYCWENETHSIDVNYEVPFIPRDVCGLSGMVGFWDFSGTSDTVVTDFSGNGFNGVMEDSSTRVAGKVGEALSFSGAGRVNLGNSALLNPVSELSIEFLMKTADDAADIGVMFSRHWSLDTGPNWAQRLSVVAGKLNFGYAGGVSLTGNADVANGVWHHVVLTHDGSSFKLYVDGVLDRSVPAPGNFISSTSNTYIGNSNYAGNYGIGHYNGLMDEVAFYNRALTTAEISGHYVSVSNGVNYCTPIEAESTCNAVNLDVYKVDRATYAVPPVGLSDDINYMTLDRSASDLTASDLANVDVLIIADTYLTGDPTHSCDSLNEWSCAANYVNIIGSFAELDVIKDAWEGGMDVILIGDNGGTPVGNSIANYWSATVTNYLTDTMYYTNYGIAYANAPLDPPTPDLAQFPFLEGVQFSLSWDGIWSPGLIYNVYSPAKCAARTVIDGSCIAAYLPRAAGRGYLFVSGNANVGSDIYTKNLIERSCQAECALPNLEGYWSFNDGSSTSVSDLSGNFNNGVVVGMGDDDLSSGVSGLALDFDGVEDYVEVANNDNLKLEKFTTAAWFKVNRLLQAGDESWVILMRGEEVQSGNLNYNTQLINSPTLFGEDSMKLACGFENTVDTNHWIIYDVHDASFVDRWIHVACTLDGNDWKMYIDGEEVSTDLRNGREAIASLGGTKPSLITSPFYVGGAFSSDGDEGGVDDVVSFFDGSIDEVSVWSKALTAVEVKNLYDKGTAGLGYCDVAPVSEIMWADMNGDEIVSADLGDTVQMIKTYAGSGSFDIFEEDDTVTDPFDDEIRNDIAGVGVGSNLIGKWTITQDDLRKTLGDYEEFRFIVDGETSEALSINPRRDDDRMVVGVENPACGTHFNQGDGTIIRVVVSDRDDEVSGSLAVSDVEVATFGNGGVIQGYTFSVPGNVQIVADANNTRGKRSRSVSSVMVLDRTVDGKYSAACIDRPRNFEDFDGNSIAIDASTSRAVRVTNGGTTATVIVPGDPGLNWYWTFSRRDGNHEIRNVLGVAGESLLAYNFTAEFPSSGNNWATLGLDLD